MKYNNAYHEFQNDINFAVNNYFEKINAPRTGDWRLFSKTAILILSVITIYWGIFMPIHYGLILGLWALLGINFAFIGFNVMHDGGHKSYSKKPWVNEVMLNTLAIIGNSPFLWVQKHNFGHHTYTNTHDDPDINLEPFMRFRKEQELRQFHRYQHIYATVLYATEYLYWVWFTDFRSFFRRKIGKRPIKRISRKDRIIFWASKAFHLTFMLILPCWHFGIGYGLLGYGVFAGVCGLFISYVFQLAHVVDETEFPTPDAAGVIPGSWAEMQVRATSNFATKSTIANWLLGGLNFQIEHHLLVDVSHVHYRALAPVVEHICLWHGIPYHKPPLPKAIGSHIRYLRRMGREQ